MDLFATRFSRQLPSYFSWRPHPEAEATDAVYQNLRAYARPPWCLIGRVLAKALCQKVTLVLVTPCWPWFPQLMEMLIDFPLVLPDPLQCQVVTPSPNCDCPVFLSWSHGGSQGTAPSRSDFRRSYQPYPRIMEREDKCHIQLSMEYRSHFGK